MTGWEREGIAVCGTVRGYLAHHYRLSAPCCFCRDAWDAWTVANQPSVFRRKTLHNVREGA